MRSKVLLAVLGFIMVGVLLSSACAAGVMIGYFVIPSAKNGAAQAPQIPTLNLAPDTNPPNGLDKLFAPFWQAWNLVHKQYIDQPVDDQKLMQGAIKGMLEALGDQHTSYMDPTEYQSVNVELQGEQYEGIGAWVDVRGEYLKIVSPMPGSPAEKAGLRPNDLVVGVNGEDMTGVDGELVRKKILGPKGSTVRLMIQREGVEEPFEVEVQRASITVPSVDYRMLDGNIAYVRLYTFGDKTMGDLKKAFKELMAQKPSGLIFDLRNNGGGYLETGIDVASQFISGGVVMYEEYGDGRKKTFEARSGGLATDIPLVVLINEGSASASEIVAGAIQDRGRGKLVGVTSFGKGSVQIFTPLVDEQGAIRITIARWMTPNGRTIHELGLKPDIEVKITDEDLKNGRDPQLDKAIELLKGR